jgi:hypothetical protein
MNLESVGCEMIMRKTFAPCLLFVVGIASIARADEWKPVEGKLMTRWAKDVSAEQLWPEYPRPQMARPKWTNLNGLWEYAIRPKGEDMPSSWDGKILVPFAVESALSGVGKTVSPEERLWYRRTFAKPELENGTRLQLNFGAVDWQCTVWVNGQEVGKHEGGFDPFTFDVTDALEDGENEVVVAVWDPTDAGNQPRGKQVRNPNGIWYTAVTGIWQTVWLEPVPAVQVQSLELVPDFDNSAFIVTTQASADSKVRVTTRHGESVAEAEGKVGQPIAVKLTNPKLWSPDAPNLYDLKVELIENGKVVDSVDSYCGLRKIEVRPDEQGVQRLFLNDQALFQYGPLDQGWWPDGLYTPATEEAMKYDIEMTQKLGMNMARKHTKYECDRWYYWCDKLGLLVWQDMPSGDSDRTPESRANYRRELKSMIDALRNHPSIVMWVPFNEGWGQHDTPEVVAWLQKYDPSRPINEASGWHDRGSGDVSDMHNYPGPGMRTVESDRVVVLGEFGGLGMPIKGHTWTDEKNWGYVSYATNEELTDAYVALLRAMRPLVSRGLSAAVYTQTSDVEVEVNGFMTYDREMVKMDADRITKETRRLYGPTPKVNTIVPTSMQAPVEWKYTLQTPQGDWHAAGFDDKQWSVAPGAYGTYAPAGGKVATPWETKDIWLRKTFTLDEVPANEDTFVLVSRDEAVEIYVNGEKVAERGGFEPNYTTIALPDRAKPLLKQGENTIAVHCNQTTGGQFIDVGLLSLEPANDEVAQRKVSVKLEPATPGPK